MSRKMAATLAVVLGLFVIACGSGSTGGGLTVVPAATGQPAATSGGAAQPTAAPAMVAKVGDRAELNGTALTVVKLDRKPALSDFQKAKDGNEFIIAEVLVENAGSDEKIPYNLLYFKVKDVDGFEYSSAFGVEQPFSSGELAKGEKARGNIAFEVKKDAKGLVLEYKPIVFGGDDAIKVALE